jgi:hypothetical protein
MNKNILRNWDKFEVGCRMSEVRSELRNLYAFQTSDFRPHAPPISLQMDTCHNVSKQYPYHVPRF